MRRLIEASSDRIVRGVKLKNKHGTTQCDESTSSDVEEAYPTMQLLDSDHEGHSGHFVKIPQVHLFCHQIETVNNI